MTLNISSPVSNLPIPTVPLTDSAVTQQPNTQASNTFAQTPQPDGPQAQKASFNPEAAAAYSTFKEAVLKSKQPAFNSPQTAEEKTTGETLSRRVRSDTASDREGAKEADDLFNTLNPSPPPALPKREGADEANDLFNALNPPETPTPAPKPPPPENGVDEKMGADTLQKTLDKDKRINAQLNPVGDSQLAKNVANALLELKEGDSASPSPMVQVPKDSTLGKWLSLAENAFMNRAVKDWARENKIDIHSMTYDSATGLVQAITLDNKEKSFPLKEFPDLREALTPLLDISKIIDPTGNGIKFNNERPDTVPLELVQNFYDLKINNKDIASAHKEAKDLLDNESFPETTKSQDHSNESILKQQNLINDFETTYTNQQYKKLAEEQEKLAIEISSITNH
ncbi:hypothetical protein [Pseudomonas gessardii]|nr:hypothetical protein [Pseudomonas gessardii]NNA65533.1 hypothetical protein [Pseudomonas gessardii]